MACSHIYYENILTADFKKERAEMAAHSKFKTVCLSACKSYVGVDHEPYYQNRRWFVSVALPY
jgi:hypothetical protein